MKRKLLSILFALVLAISLLLVPAAVSASPGPILGFWQPGDPDGGTVEYSTAKAHDSVYSVYLEGLVAYAPTADDNNEIYVGEPTGVTDLDSLTNVSFWYFCPTGGDPVPPEIDVWLASGVYDYGPPPTGDDHWLLGQFPEVTVFDTWVEVPHSTITWIEAAGGQIYGDGSAGLDAAKVEHGSDRVLAVGIQVGGPATRHEKRAGDQIFYVDDFTINAITYDFEAEGSVALTVNVPSITAISVTPTDIDFGTLNPGDASGVTVITISNVGSAAVNVDASLANLDTVFDYLELDEVLLSTWDGTSIPTSGSETVSVELVIPSDYSAKGSETNTLIFTATAQP